MTYSPALAIGTAIFEVSVAVWALRGPGRRPIIRTTSTILLLLAAYQMLEVLVCARAPMYGFMPQMAFIVVTWLPPLGLLLIAQLSPSQSHVNYAVSYFMLAVALSIVIWIALDDRFVTDSVCNVVYAKYATPLPRFQIYAWFYWVGLAGMILCSALGIRQSDDPRQRRLLKTVLTGSLSFIVPAVIVTRFVAPAEGALPSIMCHFAIALAFALARLIMLERHDETAVGSGELVMEYAGAPGQERGKNPDAR
jgi:hypothetical protein